MLLGHVDLFFKKSCSVPFFLIFFELTFLLLSCKKKKDLFVKCCKLYPCQLHVLKKVLQLHDLSLCTLLWCFLISRNGKLPVFPL